MRSVWVEKNQQSGASLRAGDGSSTPWSKLLLNNFTASKCRWKTSLPGMSVELHMKWIFELPLTEESSAVGQQSLSKVIFTLYYIGFKAWNCSREASTGAEGRSRCRWSCRTAPLGSGGPGAVPAQPAVGPGGECYKWETKASIFSKI